tara:strand:+ start:7059 stop:7775 length:717 start_codon:yes stop_codon:yes gene_type:complete
MDKPVIGFFGFARRFPREYKINLDNYRKYIFCPTRMYEDKPDTVNVDDFKKVLGDDTVVEQWDYDKTLFIDKWKGLETVPRFNQFFQQPYRIYSFFYHLGKTAEMIYRDHTVSDDTPVILIRIDVDIDKINMDKIGKLIKSGFEVVTDNKNCDRYFVTKKSKLPVFIELYEDYGKYLKDYYSRPKLNRLKTTRPEDIFNFHFSKFGKNVKRTNDRVVIHKFKHVCNPFCGHHRQKTLE